MSADEDDRPTVVLDFKALAKQKLQQEEELHSMGEEIDFSVTHESASTESSDFEEFVEDSFDHTEASAQEETLGPLFTVILFDFQSDFFQENIGQFPQGYDYQIAQNLPQLNKLLANENFQICVFNYDVNAKAVNQLTGQIKQKFPSTKTMIMARAISPQKVKIHAQSSYGAHGYYQLPLDATKIEEEFLNIENLVKKI